MTQKTQETIYIALLNEGTEVWRPVQAVCIEDGVYQIISENAVPDVEQWEFTSGELVRCVQKSFNDGTTVLTAYESLSR